MSRNPCSSRPLTFLQACEDVITGAVLAATVVVVASAFYILGSVLRGLTP